MGLGGCRGEGRGGLREGGRCAGGSEAACGPCWSPVPPSRLGACAPISIMPPHPRSAPEVARQVAEDLTSGLGGWANPSAQHTAGRRVGAATASWRCCCEV